MKQHPFDPISFVLGLFVTTLGLLFVLGDRTAAEIGVRWLWPFPVLLVGLVAVLGGIRRARGSGGHEVIEPLSDGPVEDLADPSA